MQGLFAAHNVQGRAALGASLGKNQGTVREIERRQSLATGELGSGRAPVQAAGDHQVKDQPKIIFYADRNALADAPQLADNATVCVR
jgi:hypothetical protein